MFCSNCGKEIANNSKVCAYCGTPVQAEWQPYNKVQPNYQKHYTEQSNGGAELAIVSMALGIVALGANNNILCAIASIILAVISMKENRAGKGMAVTGLVCSIISLLLAVIIWLWIWLWV